MLPRMGNRIHLDMSFSSSTWPGSFRDSTRDVLLREPFAARTRWPASRFRRLSRAINTEIARRSSIPEVSARNLRRTGRTCLRYLDDVDPMAGFRPCVFILDEIVEN